MVPAVFFFSLFVRVVACFAATSTLAHADGLPSLYFDLNSLVWMLIGALGWGSVSYWLGRRSSRHVDAPCAVSPQPVPVNPVSNADATSRDKEIEAAQKNENLMAYLTSLNEATTVTVEELSDVIEEADLFLLLGRPEMAIDLLLAHIRQEGGAGSQIWFKLLDVYRDRGMLAEFESLANNIHVRFNVSPPTWRAGLLEVESHFGLEHFPHLLAKISDSWRTTACLSFLRSLENDKRGGDEARAGFQEDAFREIIFLIEILERVDSIE